MDKFKLAQIIVGYQKLYKETESINGLQTQLFPFGDDITHFDIKDIANSLRYEIVNDVAYWSVNIDNEIFAGEIENDWIENLRKTADIEDFYFYCLEQDRKQLINKLCFIEHVLNKRK